jgi:hypothetical protein
VPLVLGDWQGRDITREESELANRSDSPQIVRRYAHRTTGATVGLLLTCGRPAGMIIEHKPWACYTELGYEGIGTGRKVPIGPPEAPGECFAYTFVKTTPVATTRVRLLWSWGDGQSWGFPDAPRVAYANKSVLYKLYVTREMLSEDEPLDSDPALEFLRAGLPLITAALVH